MDRNILDSSLLSSQPESEPDATFSSQYFPSSPPSILSDVDSCRKPKRPPPVTPRSFRRFFTPRSTLETLNNGEGIRTNRRALQEITGSTTVNRLPAFTRASNKPGSQIDSKALHTETNHTPTKKRKFTSSFDNILSSSPLRRVRIAPPIFEEQQEEKKLDEIVTKEDKPITAPKFEAEETNEELSPVLPIRRSTALRTSGALFSRSLSEYPSKRVTLRSYGAGPQDEAANFYSRPNDLHACINQRSSLPALPFCTTACNTNSLVAIGDEDGGVRLLESAKDGKPEFPQSFLSFRPHTNAIMDLEFSSDDKLLATASGDQTARIIDMPTQKTIYCLSNHSSSVKRVRFQPGNNDNVIAACSRDGNVSIWDLRCKGLEKPSMQLRCSLDSESDSPNTSSTKVKYPQVFNSIHDAHGGPSQPKGGESNKIEPRRNGLSVTSLAFLQPGREHLFVTGSEVNACVKLWDLRTAYNVRRGRALPLSTTRQPESHDKHRVYGLTSLTFGSDGARLYTSCRDGTIYTYSTSHLVLGHAPEMSLSHSRPRRSGGPDNDGLGPMYGFRHPRFQVTSFYIKAAIRPAAGDKGEMLAVGSSDNCAILFPTDERCLDSTVLNHDDEKDNNKKGTSHRPVTRLSSSLQGRPSLNRSSSGLGPSGRLEDTIPIYQHGTALVEGHEKEVSSLTWTTEGELVTVSDDYHARCWREGSDARDLRTGGEAEGRRWRCGWADVPTSYDDEEE